MEHKQSYDSFIIGKRAAELFMDSYRSCSKDGIHPLREYLLFYRHVHFYNADDNFLEFVADVFSRELEARAKEELALKELRDGEMKISTGDGIPVGAFLMDVGYLARET